MTARVETLRAAVVGAGIGQQYIGALSRQADVSVVAVCARTAASAAQVADRYDIPGRYTSYEALLEQEDLDAIVVAAPNSLHHPITLAALEAGVHVACEKPLALTLREATEMAARAETLRRCHLVAFTWRFLPAARYVKEVLDSGFVGQPYHVNLRYFVSGWGDPHGPMRWQFDAAAAGSGSLANLGSHGIHLLQWWLGDLRAVSALMNIVVPERQTANGDRVSVSVDDTCAFLAELHDGTPVAVQTSAVAFGPRVSFEIGIFGSDGAILFTDDWNAADAARGRVRVSGPGRQSWRPVRLPRRFLDEEARAADGDGPLRGCFTRMAAEFVAAIRADRPAEPSFHDGVRVQAVIDAALASAATRSWVPVDGARIGA